MLDFKSPCIEDRAWVAELMKNSRRESCEYCFGNLFIWSPVYRTHITRFEDFMISHGDNDRGMYCFPMGTGDLKKALEAIHQDSVERGSQMHLFGVTQEDRNRLETLYPGRFEFEENRDFFDYIYTQQDLALLPGKKYHAKRNHIAAFMREDDWEYEEITPQNISGCVEMDKQWYTMNVDKNPEELEHEQLALNRAIENYDALSLRGALLRKGGRVVAFTMGEAMGEHMFCTHFEKAFADVRGAYPTINRLFAERTISEFPLINREEDTGDEGLRKAKLSYHPHKLLVKYEAICKD